ncbi:MAG: hypothetical protein ACLTKG_08120 [Collinsella intestinalis]
MRDEAPVLLERLRERGELKGEMVIVVAPPSEEELERLQAVLSSGVDEVLPSIPRSCCVRISPRASPPAIRQTRWPSAWRRSTRARSATCTTWCSKRSKRYKGRVAVHAPNLLI